MIDLNTVLFVYELYLLNVLPLNDCCGHPLVVTFTDTIPVKVNRFVCIFKGQER